MKISFENQGTEKLPEINRNNPTDSKSSAKGIGSSYAVGSSLEIISPYEGKKISISELKETLKDVDVKNTQDYMTFMAHSVSSEDFSRMMEEGEFPANVPTEDMITIIDRIKLAVAKSGKKIEGFTDTLDEEKILELTGSREIAAVSSESDVTLDSEKIGEIKEALNEIRDIEDISDAMKKYLITNDCELTIDNLYIAKHSSFGSIHEQATDYFSMETEGYLAKKGSDADVTKLKEEVISLLDKIGIETSLDTVEEGMWLVKNSVCVNEENLEKLARINSLKLPMNEEKSAKAIMAAIEEGKKANQADVTRTESIYDEAVRITEELAANLEKPFIKATRMLEETRLKMTNEANLLLLRSGMKIDTKDLEAYVEKLKSLENSEEVKTALQTSEEMETIKEVKKYPVQIVAQIATRISEISISEIKEIGAPIKHRLEAANIEYEKVSTEVRRDLGDSIRKAFRNVPEILESMGIENSKENERAVRILGYNSMPITKDNFEKVRDADRKLLLALERLTPSDTIKLIREGKSPIRMSIDELNAYLDGKHKPEEEEIEKYSKFLYKLERDNNILPNEREQYIEVYRMINNLKKTDDAAVGNVIATGMQYTFENLIVSQKAAKAHGIDVRIMEEYDRVISTEGELEREWQAEEYREFKAALNSPEETISELVMNNARVTPENLEATLLLRKRRGDAFRKATEVNERRAKEKALSFADSFSSSSKDEYMRMIEECKESVFEECMGSGRYIDVKALKLVHRQLNVAKAFSFNENYEVPMEIGGEVSSVNVKLVHNLSEEPNVVISFETKDYGRISARFTKKDDEVNGYIACNLQESITKMQKVADIFGKKVSVVFSQNSDTELTLSKIPMKDNSEYVSAADLYTIARQFLASMKGL